MIKKIVTAIILGSLAIGMTGCGGSSEPTKDNSTKQEQKKEEAKKTEFKIGENIQYEGHVITVLKKEISNGGEYEKPKQGNEYVIVTVKIQNKGDKPLTYNPYDFKLKNSKGQMLDCEYITNNDSTRLDDGTLDKGGEVEGTIAFQAPKGDNKLQLIYTGNIFDTDSKITIDLQ